MVKFRLRQQVEMFSFKYLALPVVSSAYDVLHIISLFSFLGPTPGGWGVSFTRVCIILFSLLCFLLCINVFYGGLI